MPDLAARIRAEIDRDGPMRFDRFMELALYDPADGYYSQAGATRAGHAGDFVTAPTLTPFFGGALARFAAAVWERFGRPSRWTIVEIAGGTGALARGLLSALEREAPGAFRALRYTLVDVDPGHRADAADLLAPYLGLVTIAPAIPMRDGAPVLILANELLDDLPVRRVRRRGGAWWERRVASREGGFVWVEEPASDLLVDWIERTSVEVPEGQTIEVPVGAAAWLEETTFWSGRGPTVLLLVDYGEVARDLLGEPRPEGTLRAYSGQRTGMSVLERPGSRNLTAHVDWSSIAVDARDLGWRLVGFTTQSSFLIGLGSLETAAALGASVRDQAALEALSALKEVLLPGGMGEDVKVLALERGVPDAGPLRGFQDPRPVDPPQRRR